MINNYNDFVYKQLNEEQEFGSNKGSKKLGGLLKNLLGGLMKDVKDEFKKPLDDFNKKLNNQKDKDSVIKVVNDYLKTHKAALDKSMEESTTPPALVESIEDNLRTAYASIKATVGNFGNEKYTFEEIFADSPDRTKKLMDKNEKKFDKNVKGFSTDLVLSFGKPYGITKKDLLETPEEAKEQQEQEKIQQAAPEEGAEGPAAKAPAKPNEHLHTNYKDKLFEAISEDDMVKLKEDIVKWFDNTIYRNTKKTLDEIKKEEPKLILDTYHGKGIPQEKMAEKYCSADIFVEGSWQVGWNNPVAEAMACKVPVVCTDIGGVKDFAFHEKTALLVLPEDSQAMASAILRLIKDEKLRETLRENAYQHIKTFNWDKSAKRLEEILNSELTRKKDLISKISIAIHNPIKVVNKGKTILKKTLQRRGSFDKYKRLGAYHWDSYENNLEYKTHVDYIVENWEKRPKGTLLDVGCGDGLISCFLAESGFKVKGIDVESEGIKLAKRKCLSVVFKVKDIFNINEQFDYLLASEVIEHLSNPDGFLQKIKGLFRKEALVTTPNKDYYKHIDPYHMKEYNIYEFENLLKKYFRTFQIKHTQYHLYAWIKKGSKEYVSK